MLRLAPCLFRLLLPGLLLALLLPAAAGAGTFKPFLPYPSYDSVIINPFDSADENALLLHLLQPFYASATGRQIVIKDMPGRGGITAWAEVAGHGDDGYTLTLTDLPAMAMFSLRTPPPFTLDELRNVCVFAAMPLVLWAPANGAHRDLYSLVNQAFDAPGRVIIAGTGTGTPQHLATLRFNRLAGIKTSYRAHTGAEAGRQAALNGNSHAFWGAASPRMAQDGAFIPLAIASDGRHPLLPQVPTFAELSYNLDETSYFGLAISSETNPQTAQAVSAVFLNIARNPEFQAQLRAEGFFPTPVGAHEIVEYLKILRDYYAVETADYGLQ
ncbi:hypothetical protein LJC48_06755 [Desulfovibrio sp. OttesenSCG-928-C06]|nr:hypothetical protein [Desulfovibrio sp. OttesenSCG-928-C06]